MFQVLNYIIYMWFGFYLCNLEFLSFDVDNIIDFYKKRLNFNSSYEYGTLSP